jgi:hypothetical protein
MPPGFVDDMAQTMQALHRLRQEATNVLCSHDQEVFTTYRLVYSSGNSLDFNRCGKKEMKNLFERGTVDEMVSRIDTLQPTSPLQWGKMDVAQMMAHCSITMDIASGRLNPPRIFIGRLIAPFLKSIYTNEKPFGKNGPTGKELVVTDQRDFAHEQEQLKMKIRQFHEGGETKCTRHPHPFFALSHHRNGAVECTSISITTCGSSVRNRLC